MPLPKNYDKKLYRVVVATCQKRGGSRESCKAMADKAVMDKMGGKGSRRSSRKKMGR